MSAPALIQTLDADGVLLLTMNRPETMNALNGEISGGIMAAAAESRSNDAIRAIVITGNGRGFCSGADLSDGGPATSSGRVPSRAALTDKLGPGRFVMALAEASVPIIGAINGAAAGAGFGLALCCDIRIAADTARMGSIFIKRGIATDYGTSHWLPRIVGVARAFELLYSGDLMDAPKLLEIGLVHQVVPAADLLTTAMAYARKIASGPPLAYTYTRRNIMGSLERDLRTNLEDEWTRQTELLRTKDAAEGFVAHREKRPPRFSGQ